MSGKFHVTFISKETLRFRNYLRHSIILRRIARAFRVLTGKNRAWVFSSVDFARPFSPVSSQFGSPRANLLLYSIANEDLFGGISTSLRFSKAIEEEVGNIRILVTVRKPRTQDLSAFPDYSFVFPGLDSPEKKQIQYIGSGGPIPIAQNDFFISHGWWEAQRAESWSNWQSTAFKKQKPVIQILQEFEPGFYPFSGEFMAASEAIAMRCPNIAVVNTNLLANYYFDQGFKFEKKFVFEPRLNPILLDELHRVKETQKEKIILMYGRPRVHRNCFNLAIETLKNWALQFPDSKFWQVFSVGERHPDVNLGSGQIVKSLGKLTLRDYASLMGRASVGLSFMASPHPSYPPLEMSHFGMLVLTNSFANKNLSKYHANIISSESVLPVKLGNRMAEICRTVEATPQIGWEGESYMDGYLSKQKEFPFIGEILSLINSN